MFIGHFAVAFATRRVMPRVSLGMLMTATLFIDLIWPVCLLLGIEQVRIAPGDTAFTPLEFTHYPVTHSLAGAAGWSMLIALAYLAFTRYRAGAVAVGLVALSHWFLDALSHRPDLPLYPGGTLRVGLGLWNSVPATLLVEGFMFATAVWLYAKGTVARSATGNWLLGAFVLFTVIIYVASAFGPPPPNVHALAWAALAALLFPVWAEWVDRNRRNAGHGFRNFGDVHGRN